MLTFVYKKEKWRQQRTAMKVQKWSCREEVHLQTYAYSTLLERMKWGTFIYAYYTTWWYYTPGITRFITFYRVPISYYLENVVPWFPALTFATIPSITFCRSDLLHLSTLTSLCPQLFIVDENPDRTIAFVWLTTLSEHRSHVSALPHAKYTGNFCTGPTLTVCGTPSKGYGVRAFTMS